MSQFGSGLGDRSFARGKQRIALPRSGGVTPLQATGVSFGSAQAAAGAASGAGIAGQITNKLGNVGVAGSFLAQQQQIAAREDLNDALKDAAPIVNARLEQGLKIESFGSEEIADMADQGMAIKAIRDDEREFQRRIDMPTHDENGKPNEESIQITPQTREDGSVETRAEAVQRTLELYTKSNVPPNWSEKAKGIYVGGMFNKGSAIATKKLREQDVLVIEDTLAKISETIHPREGLSEGELIDAWRNAAPLTRSLNMNEGEGKAALFGEAARAAALTGDKDILGEYKSMVEPHDPDLWAQLESVNTSIRMRNKRASDFAANEAFIVALAEPGTMPAQKLIADMHRQGRISDATRVQMGAKIRAKHEGLMKDNKFNTIESMRKVMERGNTGMSEEQMETIVRSGEQDADPLKRLSLKEANSIRESYHKGNKRTADLGVVIRAVQSDGTGPALNNDKMGAYAQLAIEGGHATGDGDGNIVDVINPEALADWSLGAKRILPAHKSIIQRSIETARTPAELHMAVRGYGAYLKANPLLAAELKDGLSDRGQLVASTIESELKRLSPSVITMQDDSRKVANQEWLKRTEEVAGLAANSRLPEGTTFEQLGERADKLLSVEAKSDQALVNNLNKIIGPTMQSSGILWWGRGKPQIGVNSMAEFRSIARQEIGLRTLRMSDQQAVDEGTKAALSRLVSRRQPVSWNDTSTIEDLNPTPFDPNMEAQMKDQIQNMITTRQLPGDLDYYLQRTRPKFVTTGRAKTAEGVEVLGYWALIDDTGMPVRRTTTDTEFDIETGKPLDRDGNIIPGSKPGQVIEDQVIFAYIPDGKTDKFTATEAPSRGDVQQRLDREQEERRQSATPIKLGAGPEGQFLGDNAGPSDADRDRAAKSREQIFDFFKGIFGGGTKTREDSPLIRLGEQ